MVKHPAWIINEESVLKNSTEEAQKSDFYCYVHVWLLDNNFCTSSTDSPIVVLHYDSFICSSESHKF